MIQTTRATNKPNRAIGATRIGNDQPCPPKDCPVTGDGSLRITVNLAAESRDIADIPYTSIRTARYRENAQGEKVALLLWGEIILG